MTATDDMQLLQEYATSDSQTAFATLVERHIGLVYSTAIRRLGDPHRAEEITQAVFIILAQKAARLSSGTVLSGWLYRTTLYACADDVKKLQRRQRYEQEAFMESTLENSASDSRWNEIAPHLDEAMSQLGDQDRNALVLRFFENKPLHEVGLALGASEEAAKKRVSRAVEKLRGIFSKRGIALPAAVLGMAISANSIQAAPVALTKTVAAAALTKGVAASGSTLTLIKGALKIMAWTKAKTAIVASACVLLAAGATTAVVKKTVSSHIYEEIWKHPDSDSVAVLEKAPPILLIRSTQYPNRGSGIWTTSGKGVWVNADIIDLINFAYNFSKVRTVFPEGLPREGYDYLNTLSGNAQHTKFREEIKKRFGLIAHPESRDTDVMLLKVKDSVRLQSHLTKGGEKSNYGTGEGGIQKRIFRNVELSAITGLLENQCGKPALDQTDSKEKYDFDIQWTQKNWLSTEARRSDLQQVLRDQLDQFGLELVPGREPIEMLVVERVKK